MAHQFKCTTNIKDADGNITQTFKDEEYTADLGENLDEMSSKFGADAVYQAAKGAFVVAIQNMIRARRTAGMDQAATQEAVNSWAPGQRSSIQVDPVQALLCKWGSMSDEEKKELMTKLKSA